MRGRNHSPQEQTYELVRTGLLGISLEELRQPTSGNTARSLGPRLVPEGCLWGKHKMPD